VANGFVERAGLPIRGHAADSRNAPGLWTIKRQEIEDLGLKRCRLTVKSGCIERPILGPGLVRTPHEPFGLTVDPKIVIHAGTSCDNAHGLIRRRMCRWTEHLIDKSGRT
jgi:hypothetical protein